MIGYDEVIEVDSHHAAEVAPIAIETLRDASPSPFFLSVGFFETHRELRRPDLRARHALLAAAAEPPRHARDARDMAAFKASARSLDQGIGAVLHALHRPRPRRAHADHLHHRPRPRVPGREGDPVRPRHRRDAAHARARAASPAARSIDAMVSHLDLYPTLCELAGVEHPDFAPGHLADAARPRRGRPAARARSSPRSPSTPPTSRSAPSAPSAGSTSGASTTTRTRSSPTATTAPSKEAARGRRVGRAVVPRRAALRPGLRSRREAQPRRTTRRTPTSSPTCAQRLETLDGGDRRSPARGNRHGPRRLRFNLPTGSRERSHDQGPSRTRRGLARSMRGPAAAPSR